MVQTQLSNVCGALEDGRGQKFKPSPFCWCVRMTTQRDASQINQISLWFECASVLDLRDSRIKLFRVQVKCWFLEVFMHRNPSCSFFQFLYSGAVVFGISWKSVALVPSICTSVQPLKQSQLIAMCFLKHSSHSAFRTTEKYLCVRVHAYVVFRSEKGCLL